jgi:hypothetical protein
MLSVENKPHMLIVFLMHFNTPIGQQVFTYKFMVEGATGKALQLTMAMK